MLFWVFSGWGKICGRTHAGYYTHTDSTDVTERKTHADVVGSHGYILVPTRVVCCMVGVIVWFVFAVVRMENVTTWFTVRFSSKFWHKA